MFQLSAKYIQQIISAMPNTTTHASIPQSTLTGPTVGCLNIGQVPTQPMAIPTQPMYSSYLQMPTSMVKTSVPIPTTAYQYIGQSGVLPPPPFPFDKSINMVPFPPGFEIPKFEKYTGETCPVTHLKEFSILCQEVAYSDDYLKRLFARSLGGPTLEWLMNLSKDS